MSFVGAQNPVTSDLATQDVNGQEKKVAVLRIDYGPELGAGAGASLTLSKDLISEYDSRQPDKGQPEPNAEVKEVEKATTPSCVVVLTAKAAGSPLLKALYNLYQHVFQQGGRVEVVGFPPHFISLLNSTGVDVVSRIQSRSR